MPIGHDEQDDDRGQARRAAVAEALASVRAEGLEPSADGLARLARVADGRMMAAQAIAEALAAYRPTTTEPPGGAS
ncbi:MAG: antitoxin VbhA family protein [Gemmatimonadales bacterium]|jgi:hypothetical protein